MSQDTHVLPACQKCRIRKVRCDREAPKCSNCAKHKVACIIIDQVTGEQYARDQIRAMEEQELRLRKQLGQSVEASTLPLAEQDANGPVLQGPPTAVTTASHSGFVGDGSGLGFLHHILSEARWQQARPQILNQLAQRPRIMKHQFLPHPFPPIREANDLLQNYFTRFHIHHTFLLHHDVLTVFHRIYGDVDPDASRQPAPETVLQAATDQDRFRLYMIFAISATTRFRAGLCAEHPYGYFVAAEKLLKTIPLIKDTEAIQNLLLVARFGMYHHIGISLWEISQVCMRQCIELRLHTTPSEPLDPLVEQHWRRIFWECYVLDRYSSGILGRPFAIDEEEISVNLPVDISDEHIIASGSLALDLIPIQPEPDRFPSEMSIFTSFIQLRRISSHIHTTFYSGRRSSPTPPESHEYQDMHSVGRIYTAFSRFRTELTAWRMKLPVFADPRSLYEIKEWHDFMFQKDMLLLARGAMHSLPATSNLGSTVAIDILQACYLSAAQVIHLYADLMGKRAITWTRSYFQVIFTAGLTVTYCMNLQAFQENEGETSATGRESVETLEQCSRILSHFKENMPDTGPFAAVFDLLRGECINERNRRTDESENQVSHMSGQITPNDGNMPALPFPSHNIANGSDHLFDYTMNEMDMSAYDMNFSLTGDLMSQLEAGIGEYAWGSLPDGNTFWDQFSLA